MIKTTKYNSHTSRIKTNFNNNFTSACFGQKICKENKATKRTPSYTRHNYHLKDFIELFESKNRNRQISNNMYI